MAEVELKRLQKLVSEAQEAMEDAQDALSLERAEHLKLQRTKATELAKKDEEFKTQLEFQNQALERQKQANRKLERKLQSSTSSASASSSSSSSSSASSSSSSTAATAAAAVSSSSSFSSSSTGANINPVNNENARLSQLPHQPSQVNNSSVFPNRKRKGGGNSSSTTAWPRPGGKKGKTTDSSQAPPAAGAATRLPRSAVAASSSTTSSTTTTSSSSSSSSSLSSIVTTTGATTTPSVRTNHMWAQQREASRALTGHLSRDVKVLLGSAGYVEANLSGVVAGRSSALWTGGRRPLLTASGSRRSSIGSAGNDMGSVINSGGVSSFVARDRAAKLARELRDSADGLYKCLMDLLAEQEREIEATGAPLFAITAAALRFLCVKDAPPSIEEAALSVSRLLIATTYKRGSSDVVRSGGVSQESVSDQLCFAMHAAVTKVRKNGANRNLTRVNSGFVKEGEEDDSMVVDRALSLLNVVISIDMGEREREKLLREIQRLVSGERWKNHVWDYRGTEIVRIVCLLGGKGDVFMKNEGVRALVLSVSKAVLRERTCAYLWRQVSVVRMMVRLSSRIGDHRGFWALLHGKSKDSKEGEYPLLGEAVGLLKHKMQERAGLMRRKEKMWLDGGIGGVPTKQEREDRESAADLDELLIFGGLKMLEKVGVLGRVVGGVAKQTLVGRLGDETSSLLKMSREMGMLDPNGTSMKVFALGTFS